MATRNIEAIEHKGKVYVSLEDVQEYIVSLTRRADNVTGRQALNHVLDQLAVINDRRPV